MTLREEAVYALDNVPDYKLYELIHYMRFLAECPVTLGMPEKPRGRPRDLCGILKGKIWVADDFDESMELVTESELRALREKANQKATENQETDML